MNSLYSSKFQRKERRRERGKKGIAFLIVPYTAAVPEHCCTSRKAIAFNAANEVKLSTNQLISQWMCVYLNWIKRFAWIDHSVSEMLQLDDAIHKCFISHSICTVHMLSKCTNSTVRETEKKITNASELTAWIKYLLHFDVNKQSKNVNNKELEQQLSKIKMNCITVMFISFYFFYFLLGEHVSITVMCVQRLPMKKISNNNRRTARHRVFAQTQTQIHCCCVLI